MDNLEDVLTKMMSKIEDLEKKINTTPTIITDTVETVVKADQPYYVCLNCGHQFEYDKPRKRCPECKKQKLDLIDTHVTKVEPQVRANVSEYIAPTRKEGTNIQKYAYDDQGNIIGTIAKTEPVQFKQNLFNEAELDMNDFDPQNEALKKITRPVKSHRPKAVTVEVKCDKCGKQMTIPQYMQNRNWFTCTSCISRMAGR
jgi:DNA-directed RNA polymerase subunit RPC12/RpoP